MKYLVTLYADESRWEEQTPEQGAAEMQAYEAFGNEATAAGVMVGGEGLQPTATATTLRDPRRRAHPHRRPVRRDQGAARRLLPARVQGSRRGHRVDGEDPEHEERVERGPAGDGLRGLRRGVARPLRGGAGLSHTAGVVDRLFRRESGRAVATLIRILGDFDLAEEAVQDAFLVALERWPADGVPGNPGAWIVTTARNRAIDRLRRRRRLADKQAELLRDLERAPASEEGPGGARRHPRRPAAADLHLLPPGARPGGARRADAAHPRRADHRRGRARVPRRRADDGAAARAREAQDRAMPGIAYEVPGRSGCRRGCRRSSRRSTWSSTRATRRPPATRWCAATCAPRRCGSAACWPA